MPTSSTSPAALFPEILLWTPQSPGVCGGEDTEVHLLWSASCILFHRGGVLRRGVGFLKGIFQLEWGCLADVRLFIEQETGTGLRNGFSPFPVNILYYVSIYTFNTLLLHPCHSKKKKPFYRLCHRLTALYCPCPPPLYSVPGTQRHHYGCV